MCSWQVIGKGWLPDLCCAGISPKLFTNHFMVFSLVVLVRPFVDKSSSSSYKLLPVCHDDHSPSVCDGTRPTDETEADQCNGQC